VPAAKLAIDLSGPTARVLEGTFGENFKSGELAAPGDSFKAGVITDPKALGKAIRKDLLIPIGVKEERAFIIASDHICSHRILRFPSGTPSAKIEELVRGELPAQSTQIGIRWASIGELGGNIYVYAVACNRQAVESLAATVIAADLEPVVVEPRAVSVARALEQLDCVVLEIENGSLDALVIENHLPWVWHNFSLGQGSDEEATPRIAEAIKQHVGFHRRQYPESKLGSESPVLIAGDRIPGPAVQEAIGAMIEMPVRTLANPWRVPSYLPFTVYLACVGILSRREVGATDRQQERRRHLVEIDLLEPQSRPKKGRLGGLLPFR
jgi:hypothetical protein